MLARPAASRVSLIAAILSVLFGLTQVSAQQREESVTLVSLDSVEPYKKDGRTFVVVTGHAPTVPEGTRIQFWLTWRSMEIDRFEVIRGETERLHAEFEIKKAPRTRDKLYFRTVIFGGEQAPAVKAKLDANPEGFPPSLDPWTDHHMEQQFRLMSVQEHDEALEPVRNKFMGYVNELQRLEVVIEQESELALLGEKYADDAGRFEGAEWQRWFDEVAAGRMREIYRDLQEMLQETRFLPYRRSLVALQHLCQVHAIKAFDRSIAVYRQHGQAPPSEHVSQDGFDLPKHPRTVLERPIETDILVIQKQLGIIPTDQVEEPFEFIIADRYEGVLFRPLEKHELERGAFDRWRQRSTWKPTPDQIATLEEALIAYLSGLEQPPETPALIVHYHRQYLGFEDGGRRKIFLNLVSPSSTFAREFTRRVVLKERDPDAIIELIYDVETRRFSPPEPDQGN